MHDFDVFDALKSRKTALLAPCLQTYSERNRPRMQHFIWWDFSSNVWFWWFRFFWKLEKPIMKVQGFLFVDLTIGPLRVFLCCRIRLDFASNSTKSSHYSKPMAVLTMRLFTACSTLIVTIHQSLEDTDGEVQLHLRLQSWQQRVGLPSTRMLYVFKSITAVARSCSEINESRASWTMSAAGRWLHEATL